MFACASLAETTSDCGAASLFSGIIISLFASSSAPKCIGASPFFSPFRNIVDERPSETTASRCDEIGDGEFQSFDCNEKIIAHATAS